MNRLIPLILSLSMLLVVALPVACSGGSGSDDGATTTDEGDGQDGNTDTAGGGTTADEDATAAEDDAGAMQMDATGGAGASDDAGSVGMIEDAAMNVEDDAGPVVEEVIEDVATAPDEDDVEEPVEEPLFSFFVTSMDAMITLSGSPDGFGGDLGGLEGADGICQTIADGVGAGSKTWRAFLSATTGPDGGPVHAIDRIGDGPWYDAYGRLVSNDITGLLNERPDGNAQVVDDLPDENGVPISLIGDAHDVLTGSNTDGELFNPDPESTCNDWTSAEAIGGDILRCGHSFPREGGPGGGGPGGGGPGGGGGGKHWLSDHKLPGCTPGIIIEQLGPAPDGSTCVGCAGGYGAIYCFALTP